MSAKKRRAAAAAKQREMSKRTEREKMERKGATSKAKLSAVASSSEDNDEGLPSWFQTSPARDRRSKDSKKGNLTNSGIAELEALKKTALANKLDTLKTQSFRLNCSLRAQLAEVKKMSGKHVSSRSGIVRRLTPEQLERRKKRVKSLINTIKKKNFFTELMPIIREKGPKIWACDRVNLYQFNSASEDFISVLSASNVLNIPIGKDLVGTVGSMRVPLMNLASAPGDSNYIGLYDEMCNYLSASIVVCPVLNPFGECLGVIELINKRLGRFDVSDEKICHKIAKSIAMYLK